jgi:hypothetical protein
MHTLARWASRRRETWQSRSTWISPGLPATSSGDLRRIATFDLSNLRRWDMDVACPEKFDPDDLYELCKSKLQSSAKLVDYYTYVSTRV